MTTPRNRDALELQAERPAEGPESPESPETPDALDTPDTPDDIAPPEGSSGRTCAYFDLDKTILATSTTFALGSPMRRSGLISTTSLARGIIAQLPYLLMGADENQTSRLMERLALMSAGIERAHLQAVVCDALTTVIEPAVYAEALDLIEAHHRAGHDVVVVSASSAEMVEPIAALVGADRAIATRMEVDAEGRFTGRIEHSLLHGAKVDALVADASAHRISLSRSWAYSDSISDRPMLEAVGHPVAINPDRDLRRLADAQGWPVRDFEQPVPVRARPRTRKETAAHGPRGSGLARNATGLIAIITVIAAVVGISVIAGTAGLAVARRRDGRDDTAFPAVRDH